MENKFDITGKRFGHWTVLERDKVHPNTRNSYWICKCDCGKVKVLNRSTLVSGASKSCGCKAVYGKKGINRTHGMSDTRLYHEWRSIRRRCNRAKGKDFKTYQGKGITVCEEWDNNFEPFMEWSLANGYNDTLTIDRIDNSKGYSPDNCRWISNAEQQQNKSNTVRVMYGGKEWCLRTLCVSLGIPYKAVHHSYISAKKQGIELNIDDLINQYLSANN